MTCPGDLDVIAGGACGMEPCPPSQHQPPGVEYTHNILWIYRVYSLHIVIFNVYTFCIHLIYIVSTIYILMIYHVYTWYIHGIY